VVRCPGANKIHVEAFLKKSAAYFKVTMFIVTSNLKLTVESAGHGS
jgi:hypothetical protein